MATFDCDAAGRLTTEIADAKGELFAYLVREVPPGLSDFAVTLERLDTGAVHRVVFEFRRWRCSCEDSTYRRHKRGCCKHIPAGQAFRALARLFRREDRPLRTAV